MSASTIFADKPLTAEHKAELDRIGVIIRQWSDAFNSKAPGAKTRLEKATRDLAGELDEHL